MTLDDEGDAHKALDEWLAAESERGTGLKRLRNLRTAYPKRTIGEIVFELLGYAADLSEDNFVNGAGYAGLFPDDDDEHAPKGS